MLGLLGYNFFSNYLSEKIVHIPGTSDDMIGLSGHERSAGVVLVQITLSCCLFNTSVNIVAIFNTEVGDHIYSVQQI